jgi:hypothetical protein
MFENYEMDFDRFQYIGRDKGKSILLEGVFTVYRTIGYFIATQHNLHSCSVILQN